MAMSYSASTPTASNVTSIIICFLTLKRYQKGGIEVYKTRKFMTRELHKIKHQSIVFLVQKP